MCETGLQPIAQTDACRKRIGPVATAEDLLQAAARAPPTRKKILLSGVGLEPVNAALRNSAPDHLLLAAGVACNDIAEQKTHTEKCREHHFHMPLQHPYAAAEMNGR